MTIVAIIIPLFTYAPRFYGWFLQSYLNKLYRRLRAVEIEMDGELTPSQIETLQADLTGISRAAHILPLRHSDLFSLRLASRLTALRG